MIADPTQGEEYLNSVRDGSFKLGLGIGCDLDNYFRFKLNDFTIIAGHANVGKTAFVLWYFFCVAIKHGLTFCLYCAENEIGEQKETLIELYELARLKTIPQAKYLQASQWVNHHFKWVDHEKHFQEVGKMMSYKDVLSAFNETKCNSLVIDPYNSLRPLDGFKNGHEYDYMVASEFRMHCKIEHKAIFLLAHGNTESLRKTYPKGHDYEGYPMPLQAADIEGGGKWPNRCDNLIIPHRMTQHPERWMVTDIHVRKIKRTKTGGKPTFLDSPVRCTMQKGIYFEVEGVNPLDHTAPKQEQLKPNLEF